MVKPVDNKEDKNPNKKPSLELTPNMIMILNNVILIVVIIVSMLIMYFMIDSSMNRKIAKLLPQEEQTEEEGEDIRQEGILLDLGEFILNLADTTHRRYLKVGIAMELSKTEAEMAEAENPAPSGGHGATAVDPEAAIIAEMERYKPAIRDAVISVLSNKTSDELSTPTGKEIAKEEILEMVNNIFEGQREVMRVSFGQFIIQ